MNYTINRPGGESTTFKFDEKEIAFTDELCSRLISLKLPVEIIEQTYKPLSQAYKDLEKSYPVTGTWFSSDINHHGAAQDIYNKIKKESGFEVSVELFQDDGGKIVGECQRGTFLAKRI